MFHSGVELPEGIVVAMVMGKTNSEAKEIALISSSGWCWMVKKLVAECCGLSTY